MKRIAIFASGNGSNAENIVKYFKDNSTIKVEMLASNNPKALTMNVETVSGRAELAQILQSLQQTLKNI